MPSRPHGWSAPRLVAVAVLAGVVSVAPNASAADLGERVEGTAGPRVELVS